MLRLAVRKFVPKPQPLNQFTCKPGYHSFYIVLLTRGEDKHGVTGWRPMKPLARPETTARDAIAAPTCD
jgi:hypothetical protein